MATQRPKIDPADLPGLGAPLSEQEARAQQAARNFVRENVLPSIEEWFEEGVFPRELVGELGKLGVLGMHLQGYGCAGAGAISYGLTCLEFEAGDSGLRSFISVQGSLAMFPIWMYGSEEQKEHFLPAMAAGEMIGCFGLTEPDVGSDPGSIKTRARKAGRDWVLDGHKRWVTNGSIADVAVVWAMTEEGIRGFLVPRGTPGFATSDIKHKWSLRASVSSEITLSSCRLPAEAVLPGVVGLRGPLSCLNEARYGIIWGALGAARACYEAALSYAVERQQFGKAIAAFQLTQAKLADMALEVEKGLLLAYHLGRLKEAGRLTPEQVSLGKLNSTREALKIARTARTVLGANGVTLEHPVIRHAANLESVLTYEGTAEIHQLTIGRALTGSSAFA
ncbi:MAG TPA: acyl-CoA dehydrogenase family protein [Acidimicrobiales bacterium]|nr:acyl-CoA dehydrogenase family protein [Acidimicrobiales bacterium]